VRLPMGIVIYILSSLRTFFNRKGTVEERI
jgi:hypothetical protein